MGLDMYLSRKTYVKQWEHIEAEKQYDVTVTKGGKATDIDPKKVSYIVEEVGYWRKANAIHQWFVANVQEGVDNCGEYYVPREKLQELRDLCAAVLGGAQAAPEALPTQSGFFFGSTSYDEYYREDLSETVRIIDEALATEAGDFYYQSSW